MASTPSVYLAGKNTVGGRIDALVTSINGQYAYIVNNGGLYSYKRDRVTGALTQIGTVIKLDSLGGAIIVTHPSGQWLMVEGALNIRVYKITADGTLLPKPVSEAAADNISNICVSNNGFFVYTFKTLTGRNSISPSWISCYSFDPAYGMITALPDLTIGGPGNAYGITVLKEGNGLVVTSSSNPPATPLGAVQTYSLNPQNGAISKTCVDQISGHTKCPLSIYSQGPFIYVFENEVITMRGTAYGVSAYRVDPTSLKITELAGSPYSPALPPVLGTITPKRLYIMGSTGLYSDDTRGAFNYTIDAKTGKLTADNAMIPVLGTPQLLVVNATEHSYYLSSLRNVPGGQFESSLDIYDTPFPYLTCDVTTGLQNTLFSATINKLGIGTISAAGFYYGTDTSPDANDTTVSGLVKDTAFSASVATNLLTTGTLYYVRAFVTTKQGETFLGDVQTFSLTYPLISKFSQSPIGIGATLTITGQFFSSTAKNNVVTFAKNATAVPSSATATTLVVTIPAGTVSGNVFVTTSGVQGFTSPQQLQIQPVPQITLLQPAIAGVGALITLKGAGFSNAIVYFAGNVSAPAQAVSADGTSLTVLVPANAKSGALTVSCNGIVSPPSAMAFTVQIQPTISTLSALLAATGTSVTLTGTQFSPTGLNQVVFSTGSSTVTATAENVTATSLTVVVPANAISSKLTVVCNGVTSAASAKSLTILQVKESALPQQKYYVAACNSTGTVVSIESGKAVANTSTDFGITWGAEQSMVALFPAKLTGLRLTDVFHVAGYFYISGYTSAPTANGGTITTGFLFSSATGTGWSFIPTGPALLSLVRSSGSALLGVRNYPVTASSTKQAVTFTGTTATQLYSSSILTGVNVRGSAFGNTSFVLLPDTAKIITCNNTGSNPQTLSAPANVTFPANGFDGVCWSPLLKMFIAVGAACCFSQDGISWKPFTTLPQYVNPGETPIYIASSANYILIGTNAGCLYASPDGATWFLVKKEAFGNRVQITDILLTGTTFIAFASDAEVYKITPA